MTRHLLETQVMRRILSLPLFWKILMPAAVAILCLSSYVAFSTLVFHRNNDRLEAVRDVHFPMLDAMTRNVAALDKLINGLNGAAAAGDADMLAATKPVADEIHASYVKLQKSDPANAKELAGLGKQFDQYYGLAHGVAAAFVEQREPDAAQMSAMAPALETYRTTLTAMQKRADARFRGTVQEAVDSSVAASIGGLVLGLVGAVLCIAFGWIVARAITQPLNRAVGIAHAVSSGKLDNSISIDRNDEVGQLLQAMDSMQRQLRRVIQAQTDMGDKHEAGMVSHRIAEQEFPGEFGSMVRASNALVSSHIAVTMQIVALTERYAAGDLSQQLEPLPGEKAVISQSINDVRASLLSINGEIKRLASAAAAGDFSARGDETAFEHDFRQIVVDLNHLMSSSDKSLGAVSQVLQAIASGDLTTRMHGDFAGVFARMRDDANTTVDRLTDIVGRIQHSSSEIDTAAGEIAAGNQDLSRRTEQQAASLEETAASMEELTSTVRQNAEHALQANELARNAASVASKGGEVVSQVVGTMSGIETSSKKIAEIISVIDGIAFQTNILALNAAVEAARAGEQGRGFAVVASEVRTLAQRSSAAAKEIKELIDASVGKVAEGSVLVHKAGTTMTEIVASVNRVTDIMGQITAASSEQSAGIEQVNQTVIQMDETTQQNAALVEEAMAAARAMEKQSSTLTQLVSLFQLQPASAPQLEKEVA
ncbi:methyl-accepting chemotaxis protein [Xanthomonas arboricola]|uniref:methyl-accepting chemotaxis protein n=1 Tax=Xanthomonas arboricola TaxID=56448 RepID=UPI000CEE453A|nr:methyl-accepting chemotaxis protein [Xanthomonas arboricola]PPU51687.1 methyl-accepting chemotaxis protein [Xanthomonas arboricola]